ncbi:RNA polymerase, sigma 27/28 subunit, RpsK/SigK [Peptoniphilus asaccharolyticus DSM 20463]|uniref:RNA polymerase, sigma 27/28 subunit, RpsK/SigK n=1 Tax=Peptoniphilus asaccharolyticus DSM 20463 TaxID=573058 RepID=A0A1W1VAS6_PEPAS|nr:sigma-70 family RNA polymerase sigma factor [Peptoniphilus asaccharolyticus]MBL7575750.1 sigma-70 family RNA polymerase sigma factor [Peptoniphilus asaccharolyticus]SMB90151.1 RNA polymerase, sigma 27/28 subunit, RpsK/SigK [Peptoniphilus asaccharolyticus DSM 20463]
MDSNNRLLFKEYQKDKGNINLRNQIVIENMALVPYSIKKNRSYVDGIHDYEELLQEGYYKLIKAVETFDPDLGFKFSTYAIKYLLSISRDRQEYNKDISLDTPISTNDESLTVEETVKDDSINIESDVLDREFYKNVRLQLNFNLSSKEINIIRLLYGIGTDRKSLNDIATLINVSKGEVSRIQKKALNKLRKYNYFKDLYRERNISYISGIRYDREKTSKTYRISRPTEDKAIDLVGLENNIINDMYHGFESY